MFHHFQEVFSGPLNTPGGDGIREVLARVIHITVAYISNIDTCMDINNEIIDYEIVA